MCSSQLPVRSRPKPIVRLPHRDAYPPAIDSTRTGNTDIALSPPRSNIIDTLPNELLLTILGLAPLQDRTKVRRVSKKWSSFIYDVGYHLEPLFIDESSCIPFYSDDVPIRVHTHASMWNSMDFYHLQKRMDQDIPYAELTQVTYSAVLRWKRSEFLTSPPISTLALQITAPPGSPRQPMHAMIRTVTPAVKGEGIRIGDLLDMLEKMRAYDATLSLKGWGFTAWFATKGDGFEFEDAGEQVTRRNGLEIRKCTVKES
jgi:hypothetical protein